MMFFSLSLSCVSVIPFSLSLFTLYCFQKQRLITHAVHLSVCSYVEAFFGSADISSLTKNCVAIVCFKLLGCANRKSVLCKSTDA